MTSRAYGDNICARRRLGAKESLPPPLLSSGGDTLPHQSRNRGLLARQREADGTVQTPALNFFQLRFFFPFFLSGEDESERHVIIKANKAASSSVGERQERSNFITAARMKSDRYAFHSGYLRNDAALTKTGEKSCWRGEFGNAAGKFIDGSLESIS